MLFSLLLSMLLVAPAWADIVVDFPGCYWFQGEVVAAKPESLRLKIYPGTDSEETIEIGLQGKPRTFFSRAQVEVLANVEGRGPLDKTKLTADTERIATLKPREANAGRVGLWSGEAKKGKCP